MESNAIKIIHIFKILLLDRGGITRMLFHQGSGRIRLAILDHDVVINEESPTCYILSPQEFIWIPGAIRALSMLSAADIEISVATNQSCVGIGLIDEAGLGRIHDEMKNEAAETGADQNNKTLARSTAPLCNKPGT